MSANLPLEDNAFAAEDMEQRVIEREIQRLRRHLGLEETPDEPKLSPPDQVALFFIEITPGSSRGAKCKLPSCSKNIRRREYRVALNPGMNGPSWVRTANQNSGIPPLVDVE
jgi:hypothetical protein